MRPVLSFKAVNYESAPISDDHDDNDDGAEDLSSLPRSTAWHRRHGRPSRKQKAVKQQYLTPLEEKAFVDYALHMDRLTYFPAEGITRLS